MGRADGVEADLLQLFHLARLGVVQAHRADDAVVVVQAAAAQLDDLPVDAQAVLHVRLDGADAEQHALFIDGRVLRGDHAGLVGARVLCPHDEPIEVRRLGAPELWRVHGQRRAGRRRAHRRHLYERLRRADGVAADLVHQRELHFRESVLGIIVAYLGTDLQIGGLGRAVRRVLDLPRVARQPAERHVQLRHVRERHATEQPRAGVPARVRLHAGVDGDDDAVRLARIDQLRDVGLKGRVAVVLQRGLRAVDLDRGVHHRAVQPQRHALARPFRGDLDLLPVVRNARVVVAAGRLGRRVCAHVALNHVVVRQVHDALLQRPQQPCGTVDEAVSKVPFPVDVCASHGVSPSHVYCLLI